MAFLLGVLLVPGLDLVRVDISYAGMVNNALQSQADDGAAVVLSLAHLGSPESRHASAHLPDEILPDDIAIKVERSNVTNDSRIAAAMPAPDACAKADPRFLGGFQVLLREVAALKQQRVRQGTALARTTVVGTASTYNPYTDGGDAEYFETASGDLYDPADWTAAIQIDLRNYFGGVRYGRNYRPAYALVESDGKQAIVRINDVGPLRPGRVIDLNEQSMRYFDPSLQLGLVQDVRVTLLPGDDWTPGPVGDAPAVSIASAD